MRFAPNKALRSLAASAHSQQRHALALGVSGGWCGPTTCMATIRTQCRHQSMGTDFSMVGTEKKITEADVENEVTRRTMRKELEGSPFEVPLTEAEVELETRAATEFHGNTYRAAQAIQAEMAEKAKAEKPATRVPFTPELAAKILKVKQEGGVVQERSRKREAEMRRLAAEADARLRAAAAAERAGHTVVHHDYEPAAMYPDEASAFADIRSPSTVAAAANVEPSELAEVTRNASLEEFLGDGRGTSLAEQQEQSNLPLEMALKCIYENRRNDRDLVGEAFESLTRTLYEKRHAGARLAKEVSLKDGEFAIPGSPNAVLTSSRRDAELLGGEVVSNDALLEGAGENTVTPLQMFKKKKEAMKRAEEAAEAAGNLPLKPLSQFSDRERRNYAKAVQEMTWIEEWAVQEIIIAFNEAEKSFRGTPEEYRMQLERVRDTIHESILNKVDQAVHERINGKPLAYILGSTPFLDTEILCSPPVMCPRTETEHWVGWLLNTLSRAAIEEATPKPSKIETVAEEILSTADLLAVQLRRSFFNENVRYDPNKFKRKIPVPDDPTSLAANKMDVLDLGCGSGAIGIAIAKGVVGANVVAVDLLPEAVELSRQNAMHNRIPKWKYRVEESDFFALIVHNAIYRASLEKSKQTALKKAREEGKANTEATAVMNTNDTDGATTPLFIPDMSQLGQLLDEKELHATMHFLSKANADKEPMLPVTYDLIVCNPPYVHPDDFKFTVENNNGVEWETEMAIVGDPRRRQQQQLYYRDLCILGHKFSKPIDKRPSWIPKSCPSIAFEVGIQGAVVADLFTQSKLWDNVLLHVDGEKMPRWITAVRKDFDW